MSPYYHEGDYLFVTRIFFKYLIKKNRDVVFTHDKIGLMLKRVHTVKIEEKSFVAFGTGQNSMDSSQIGDIPFDKAVGIVFYKL